MIDIPFEQIRPNFNPYGVTDKFLNKVTIFNDIQADGENPRRFERFVINRCMIYNQLSESANGTISKIVNTHNVITKDVEHYKSPREYKLLTINERERYYTVQINDFVVPEVVNDVVSTASEWSALQKKYKGYGFSVTAVNVSVCGMVVNNIRIIHA